MSVEKIIPKLWALVDKLSQEYPNKSFALDGRLVGDIGEIIAQENYQIRLFEGQVYKYDGVDKKNRNVQIKTTFKDSLNIPCKKEKVPDYYLGLKINHDGSFEEVFNGPGIKIWEIVKGRKDTSIGSHSVSINTLKKLNQKVRIKDKISRK
jgi:hypothetical protein